MIVRRNVNPATRAAFPVVALSWRSMEKSDDTVTWPLNIELENVDAYQYGFKEGDLDFTRDSDEVIAFRDA